jgi:mannose-6-phosphate isomerase
MQQSLGGFAHGKTMLHSLQQPLRFEPYFRPMIWGGRKIARYLGKNLPTQDAYGESWEVSDHALHQSRLATASHFGVTLRQLMRQHRRELLGTAAERFAVFPWLIKLLDANDWLSVQVHPDDDAVKKLWPGESAKTEAWHVLDAAPGSRLYVGLKPGIGPQQLREALERGTVAECLHAFTPHVGDFVFIPAGTVHALGGGLLIAEIQQTSDATFRLFDWNRLDASGQPRKLHIEESLASIHWDQGPIAPITATEARQRLVACPYFEIERLERASSFPLGELNRLQALIVTQGQGRFDNGEFVIPGDVWILPAALPRTMLHPDAPLAGLLCSLPS